MQRRFIMLFQVEPSSGPVEGGTKVVLKGAMFGKSNSNDVIERSVSFASFDFCNELQFVNENT